MASVADTQFGEVKLALFCKTPLVPPELAVQKSRAWLFVGTIASVGCATAEFMPVSKTGVMRNKQSLVFMVLTDRFPFACRTYSALRG